MPQHKSDPKTEALRRRGCLHPHSEQVSDDLFTTNLFFDPRDLLQVKDEMLRRVRVDGHTVSQTAAAFGVSRPFFYQTRERYEKGGLLGLLPQKPGPRHPHKLSKEVLELLRRRRDQEPGLNAIALAKEVQKRFAFSVHPRSIERALAHQGKKRRP